MNKNNESLYQQQKLWAIHLGQLSCTMQHTGETELRIQKTLQNPITTPFTSTLSTPQFKESCNGGNHPNLCRVEARDWAGPWQPKSRGFPKCGLQVRSQPTKGFEQCMNYKHYPENGLILSFQLKNIIKHKAFRNSHRIPSSASNRSQYTQ